MIGIGKGSHPYALNCEGCGRYRGRLSEPVIKFLREIVKNFGAPVEPVRIKDSGSDPECESAASPAHAHLREDNVMPTKSEAFPSTFYRAADIPEPILLTIDHVSVERLGEGRDAKDKYVAYFKEPNSKGLVISPTKWDAIALIARDDNSDNWSGVQIVLYRDKVLFGGKMVDGMKIRAPRRRASTPSNPQPPAPVAAVETAATFADDEIPF